MLQAFSLRAAIHISAVFGIYMSLAMLIPAFVDLYYGSADWVVFALSAFFTGGLSLAVALASQGRAPVVSSRFAFLLVNMLWFTAAAAGTIPFLASSIDMRLADAVFEAVSAVTTTGSTALVGLDALPPGMLLWRSLLQWMGGLGVIALGLFILPFLNVGGVSYFKIESTDIEDRPFERLSTFTISMVAIYALLTLMCGIAYAAAGMTGFDAVNHALTTISTAGFSTHDDSFGHFDDRPAIMWVAILFMCIGALPFSILILLAVRGRIDALRDPQLRAFLGYALAFCLAMTIYLRFETDMPFFEAVTHATFNIVSLVTTTGYSTHDYALWGPFAIALAFIATFPGGCSGSTTGGIKAYRFIILFELMANRLRRLVYPNSVQPVRYGDRPVDEDMQRAVVLFIASFFVLWAAATLLLAATGLDLVTALTGALTALTNVGPGLGDFIGPKGSFALVPDFAKWVMALAMLFGRLEILAVLVLFTPVFWRR